MAIIQELEHPIIMPEALGKKVVVRIAPSPTGYLHLGTARTALFNFLFARKQGGTFILRIEDTDQKRSTKEFEDDIYAGLQFLSLVPDQIFKQSERTLIYKQYITELIAKDAAYISKEKSVEDQSREVEVVRLRNPGKTISFNDLIHGIISFDTTELKDFVIARSVTEPLYHFAVVVDDHEMGITHVIRGEDHISNTPRQILIQEALGFERPQYAHIPLILAPDRSKLSKRGGATPLREYQKGGYLPEALLNYLALLGWHPEDDREVFSLSELIDLFDLSCVQKGGAAFNLEKLNWINREHLKRMDAEDLIHHVETSLPPSVRELPQYSQARLRNALPVLLERIHTLGELKEMAESGSLRYFFAEPELTATKISWQKESDTAKTSSHLNQAIALLTKIPTSSFTAEKIKEALWEYATAEGRGAVLWPVRYALSGAKESPDPFTLGEIFGKEETLNRLHKAFATIAK